MSLNALGILILLIILGLFIQWLFIYTAVKHAIKNAIHEEIHFIKTYDPSTMKTPEEDFQEELDGWS